MRTTVLWFLGASMALGADPEVLWTHDAGERTKGFEVRGSYLLVNRGDGTFSCLSRATGRELWSRPVSWADQRDLVDGRHLHVARGNPATPSRIEAIDLETGETTGTWDSRGAEVLRTPHGWYGLDGRRVFRLDPVTLARRPFADLARSFASQRSRAAASMEAAGDDPVELVAADDGLYAHACLERGNGWKLVLVRLGTDGKLQWTRTLEGRGGSGLSSLAQVYYVNDVDDRVLLEEIIDETHWLTVLRRKDGRMLARHPQPDSLRWVLIEGHGGALTHGSRLFRAGRSVLHRNGGDLCVVDLESGKQRVLRGVVASASGVDGWLADGGRVIVRLRTDSGGERLLAISLERSAVAWTLDTARARSLARDGDWLLIEERTDRAAFSRIGLPSGERFPVEGVGTTFLGFHGGVAHFTSDYERTRTMGWVRLRLSNGGSEQEGIRGTYTRVLGPRWFVASDRGVGGGDLNVLDLASGTWTWSIRKPGAADAQQLEEVDGVFYLSSRGGTILAVRP